MIQVLPFPVAPSPVAAVPWAQLRDLALAACDAAETRRAYARALDDFYRWYAARPREGFTRAVVAEWRALLAERGLGPASINIRLSAIRKFASEAAENGLIPVETAGAIARLRGIRALGRRTGNWLTLRQAQAVLQASGEERLIGLRDRVILAILIGCGLRRSEVAALSIEQIQLRENRWCITNLTGKHGRVRTVPVPMWVKAGIDSWTSAAGAVAGRVFRAVDKAGVVRGEGLSSKAIYRVVERRVRLIAPGIAPHDLRRTCAKLCRAAGGELEQIQLLLGHASIQTTERYLGTEQDLVHAPNDAIRLRL